jgi:hypothetical protein
MPPQKRTPAGGGVGVLVGDHAVKMIPSSSKPARVGQLIDRYGHVHSEAVLNNWSPKALKALGIHRIGDEPEGGTQ